MTNKNRLGLLLMATIAMTGVTDQPVLAAEAPVTEVIDAEELKGIKRVAISSFMVQYVLAQEATSKGGANSGIDVSTQVSREQLQSATETIFAEFQKDLLASGIEVVPQDKVMALPSYQTMVGKSPATPREESTWSRGKGGGYNSVMMVPKGMPLVMADEYDHLKSGWKSVGDPTLSFTGRISLYSTNWSYYDKDVQKDLDAATLHVRIFVPLAVTSTNTWMAANWQRDRSTTTAALRIGERLTRLSVGHDGDIAKIILKDPVYMDGVISESQAEKPGYTLSGVLFGKKNHELNFTLDTNAYLKTVSAAADTVLEQFIKTLIQNR